MKPGPKTWVHSAAALTAGHVVYNIKYLGNVEVSSPKGADIVKEAVTKLKFNKQVKRSEGAKPPKKELTISVDGVTIQDRQTKEKQFTYPLHHISYCADDKSDKKICAFIAKEVKENKHMCHVMESDKNAEEITLTVGQAFDLAYQKFLSNANKTQENESLQKRVDDLEAENKKLKQRIVELEIKQGLQPSYSPQTNGELDGTSSSKFNPFNSPPESNGSSSTSGGQTPPPASEPLTVMNLLADFKPSSLDFPQADIPEQNASFSSAIAPSNTLAKQAAAYQAQTSRSNSVSSSSAFDDAFTPSAPPFAPSMELASAPATKTSEHFFPPPPPGAPRYKNLPSPIALAPPQQPEPQSPVNPSPTLNSAQSSGAPGIARSRPRPQGAQQGQGVGIAPPPRSLRKGDSFGPLSPALSPPSANAGLGIDDLYAAVSKASKMNGSGAATTTSPNPFSAAPSTQFGFGDNLDFLSNKGSSNVSATNTSSSANAFSIMDLDPLK